MKKFTFVLAALAAATFSFATSFEKKSLEEIASSDKVIVTMKVGDVVYAMSHSSVNSKGAPNAVSVTVTNNKIENEDAGLEWNLVYNSTKSNFTLGVGGNTKYLYSTADNNGLRIGTLQAGKEETVLFSIKSDYIYCENTGRYIGVYNKTDWRSYTSINANIKDQTLTFYVAETAAANVATPVLNAEEGKVTDGNFTEAFTLTMTCATEGASIYYTLDGTDPAESETAVEYTAAITIPAKSTKVRAIAMDGTTAEFSREATATYCYVNTAATAYTVSEAIDVIDADLGLGNELCVKGTIKEVQSYNETYHSLTYVITDGLKYLLVYSGLGLNKAEFTGMTDLAVGDNVVVCGKLKLYKDTYEFDYNNYLVSHEGTPSSIDNATEAVKAVKVIENGQMVIIRGGVKYNAQGAVIE